jgi:DHA1 family bicyclomycin/chloramphenicol resistance-like MFS transporter
MAVGAHGDQSGTASSLYGFAVFTASGLVSPVAGTIGIHDASSLSGVLVATGVVAVLGSLTVVRSARSAGDPALLSSTRARSEEDPRS